MRGAWAGPPPPQPLWTTHFLSICGMKQMLEPVVAIATFIALVVALVTIVRKAGYSGWWVLLGPVPVVGVVMFVVFALCRWPIYKEVVRLRVMTNTANEQDYNSVLSMAVSAERKGDSAIACSLFGLLVSNCDDEEIRSYAKQRIDHIRAMELMRRGSENPYSSPGV